MEYIDYIIKNTMIHTYKRRPKGSSKQYSRIMFGILIMFWSWSCNNYFIVIDALEK